jgi:branched-chain amino acid transport system substrate-binding protein
LRPTGKVTYFRIVTTDNNEGSATAGYLYQTLQYSKAWVIDDAESYGVVIANAFIGEWKKLGGTVLGHSSEPSTTTSYVSLLTQIAAMHPDVIYFGGTDSTGGILMRRQMQQVPALQNTPFAGGDGIVTSSFASTIGTSGGPVYGGDAVVDTSQSPAAQAFARTYEAAFTDPMNAYSALAYDCTNILIQAIKAALAHGAHTPRDSNDAAGARAFRQAVIAAIQGISYTGVTGQQSFDANGDTTSRIITIYQLAVVSGQPGWKYIASVP